MPFPKVRRLLALVAVLVGTLALPAAALAQDDGVTIDPGSPAGKQYQLPTDESRQVAGGSGATDRAAAGDDDGGSGSSTAIVVGAVIVVVLIGGATAVVVRRRS